MTRRTGKGILVLTLAALFVVEAASVASACPNCKEAVSASEGQVANMATGYNWSVVFMLTVPFSLLGTGALVVHRAVKRGMLPEM